MSIGGIHISKEWQYMDEKDNKMTVKRWEKNKDKEMKWGHTQLKDGVEKKTFIRDMWKNLGGVFWIAVDK